eukprot:TRINITY_DN5453_c0_g1_i1.p1 TRINITY_DN5453_c0_g1~~TRINITY_DN5453_c0_g1_i1.p1  ORF type:complete len:376 (+),score=64.01 TRINITY_DN5453_c0_g1_i1:25-1128(+)
MTQFVLPVEVHNRIVSAEFERRGYSADEARSMAEFSEMAAWHGIKTHNAIKALHLDSDLGSGNKTNPGCVPRAEIEKLPSRFPACQRWNANRKLGPAVAFEAIEECMRMADTYGVGVVSVDNAFHYLWGGGFVMQAAKKGYFAYTNCTAAKAEVVPFGGKYPTLGTNPHSWGVPSVDAVGFPIVIDWATSTVAMGRVAVAKKEGQTLPPHSAVDADGNETTDPHKVVALLPFGNHKGYGLSLLNELYSGFIGGSLPTLRSCPEIAPEGEKTSCTFFFQVIHPEALTVGPFAKGRTQAENLKAVIDDIMGHGNSETGRCMLPGEIEHQGALKSQKAGGILFTEAEIDELSRVAQENGITLDKATLARA